MRKLLLVVLASSVTGTSLGERTFSYTATFKP